MSFGCAAARPGGASAGPRDRVDRWVQQQGGLVRDGCHCSRASAALARLGTRDLATTEGPVRLSVEVLATDRPAAYAWPCGRIFVSRGLMQLLDDDELSAAIAHEAGHLQADPLPIDEVALAGHHGHSTDCEMTADRAGQRLLSRAGLPASALPTMLRKVARSPSTTPGTRQSMLDRAALLE